MLEFNIMNPKNPRLNRSPNKNCHHLGHWLLVVSIRTLKFMIFAPLGFYLTGIGYSLSKQTINNFLPEPSLSRFDQFLSVLPFFQKISVFIDQQIFFWAKDIPDWRTVVLGMPTMLIGLIILLTVFFDLLLALFDPQFQKTHCPLCQRQKH